MSKIVATIISASQPTKWQPTGIPTARANWVIRSHLNAPYTLQTWFPLQIQGGTRVRWGEGFARVFKKARYVYNKG